MHGVVSFSRNDIRVGGEKNSKDSRNVFSRPLHSVLQQSLVVEILKNVQASCQPIQQACLLQFTSLQKRHVEQVSWGHEAHVCALRRNRLQLSAKEPQEPEWQRRIYRVLHVRNGALRERRAVQVHARAAEGIQESFGGTGPKFVRRHVCFVAPVHRVTVKLFSRGVKLTQMPPAWVDAPI